MKKIENFAKVEKNMKFSSRNILLNLKVSNPEIRATRFRNPTKGPGRCHAPKWTVVGTAESLISSKISSRTTLVIFSTASTQTKKSLKGQLDYTLIALGSNGQVGPFRNYTSFLEQCLR